MSVVRMALVGCGSVSYNRYFPNFSRIPRSQLVAVCDTDPERARKAGETAGVPFFTDFDEMLAKADFDLLLNTTSIPAHYPLNLQALQANKHIYTQKPMTVTVAQANELIDEARKRQLVIIAEDHKPLQPDYVAMRSLLRAGVIGKVCWVRCNRTHLASAFQDYWPTDPTWKYKKGAGPLIEVGVEGLHGVCSLLGPAKRVTAMSGINQKEIVVRSGPCKGKRIEVEADDVSLLTMDFGDAVFCQLDTAWTATHVGGRGQRTPHLEIYGSKGSINVRGDGKEQQIIEVWRDNPELGVRGWQTIDIIPQTFPAPPLRAIGVVHAVECILDGQRPILSAELARHCIEIMEKAFIAARTGITQTLETTFDPIP
jgi:predicted dehydrogenase